MLAGAVRLSLQEQYAICGMFDLAYNGEAGPIQVRVIGERQRIPARTLEQIFQRLRRAGLVAAKRGPGGGYQLARPAGSITLRAIVEAVEGSLEHRLGAPHPAGEADATHRPDFVWSELGKRVGDALSGLDLEAMCRRAAARGVRRAGAESRMWHI